MILYVSLVVHLLAVFVATSDVQLVRYVRTSDVVTSDTNIILQIPATSRVQCSSLCRNRMHECRAFAYDPDFCVLYSNVSRRSVVLSPSDTSTIYYDRHVLAETALGRYKFAVVMQNLSLVNAEQYCSDNGFDEVAKPKTLQVLDELRRWLRDLFVDYGELKLWIGYADPSESHPLGETPPFSLDDHWAPGEPLLEYYTEKCLFLGSASDFKLGDGHCWRREWFICERSIAV